MPDSIIPIRLWPRLVRRGADAAHPDRTAHGRKRREHDDAVAQDPSFAREHRLQVAHSIEIGRGGCPYCTQ